VFLVFFVDVHADGLAGFDDRAPKFELFRRRHVSDVRAFLCASFFVGDYERHQPPASFFFL
jgi:hypothetical protein